MSEDTVYINEPRKAKDWKVGDHLDIFWTAFKTGEYEDEVRERFDNQIKEAREKGNEEKSKDIEEICESYFEHNHIADDGEIETLINGGMEIFAKHLKDDGSIIYEIVGGYGDALQIRISPEDYERMITVSYNSTSLAEKYIKEEYRQPRGR